MIHLLLQKLVQSSCLGLHLFGSAQIPNEVPCSVLSHRHSPRFMALVYQESDRDTHPVSGNRTQVMSG